MRYTIEYSPDFFDEDDELVHPAELDLLAIDNPAPNADRTNIVLRGTHAQALFENGHFTDEQRDSLLEGYNIEADISLYPAWEATFNGQILE